MTTRNITHLRRQLSNGGTPWQHYRQLCREGKLQFDKTQLGILHHLNRLHCKLNPASKCWKHPLVRYHLCHRTASCIYLWGPVGCGKTMLVDLFQHCQPEGTVKRVHFHAAMREIHTDLQTLQHQSDPIKVVARQFVAGSQVLIFDEFVVKDIANAMILAGLLRTWLDLGIHLIFTSNTVPDNLYKDGIQREQFLPAIEMLNQHFAVVGLHTDHDYRRHFLVTSPLYLQPDNDETQAQLETLFRHFADEASCREPLKVEGRTIDVIKTGGRVAWFTFDELCRPPRSQMDYLSLIEDFDVIIVSHIRALRPDQCDPALLFIKLVDILYDNHKLLICSADCDKDAIYPKGRLAASFRRTRSRLCEMECNEYRERFLERCE